MYMSGKKKTLFEGITQKPAPQNVKITMSTFKKKLQIYKRAEKDKPF